MVESNQVPKLKPGTRIVINPNFNLIVNDIDEIRFKVSDAVIQLVELIDGNRNIEEIHDIMKSQHGYNLSLKTFKEHLFGLLESKGIIVGNVGSERLETRNYLKTTYTLISGKHVLILARIFSFLFQRKYVAICTAIFVLSAIYVLTIQIDISYNTIFNKTALSDFYLLIPIFICNLIWHEIGHSSACLFFGTNPSRIGIGFYFFNPVLFADVSNAWELQKWQRIKVNLAGAYFESIFASMLVAFSFFFKSDILIIIASFILCQSLLLNLNPFLRADGYWIVSDILEIPNLKKKSQQVTKHLFTGTAPKNGKEIFLCTYGIINLLVLIGFIVISLFHNHQNILKFPNNILHIAEFDYFYEWINKIIFPVAFYIVIYRFIIRMLFKKNS